MFPEAREGKPPNIKTFQLSAYITCANILLTNKSHKVKLRCKEWTPTLDGQGAAKSPSRETHTRENSVSISSVYRSPCSGYKLFTFLPTRKYTYPHPKTLKTLMPSVVSDLK